MSTKERGYEEEVLSNTQIKDRATNSGIVLVVRQFVMRGLGVLGIFVLAKILSPEIFGIFAVLQFIVVLFEELGALGLPAALIRREERVTHRQLSQVFSVQLFALVLSCIFIFFSAPLVIAHYELQSSATLALQLMILALIFSALKSVPKIVLQRSFRHADIAKAEIAEYLFYLILTIGLALIGLGIWALVAGAIARSFVGMVMLHRYAGWRAAVTPDFTGLYDLFKFAVPMQITKAVELANNAVLPVVVGSLFGVSAVGILNLARTLLDAAIAQPINLIGRVQFRLFGVMQGDSDRLKVNIERCYLLGCTIAFGLVAVLVSTIEPIVALLLGEKWQGVAPALQIMAVGYGFYAVANPANQSTKALGYPWLPLLALVVWTVLSLLSIYAFADTFGSLSYPIAIAISIPCGAGLLWLFSVGKTNAYAYREILVPVLAAVASSAPVLAGLYDNLGDVAKCVIAPAVAASIYLLVIGLLAGARLAGLIDLLLTARSGLPNVMKLFLAAMANSLRKVSVSAS